MGSLEIMDPIKNHLTKQGLYEKRLIRGECCYKGCKEFGMPYGKHPHEFFFLCSYHFNMTIDNMGCFTSRLIVNYSGNAITLV